MGRDTEFDFGFNDPARICDDEIVCRSCGRRYGKCCDVQVELANNELASLTDPGVTPEEYERNHMINRSSRGTSNGGGNTRQQRTGFPYLKKEHCSHNREVATILDTRTGKDKWNNDAVEVKIKFRNQVFLYPLRDNNPNLDILCNAFGTDETKWKDQQFNLFLEVEDFSGNTNIRTEALPSGPGVTTTRSKQK